MLEVMPHTQTCGSSPEKRTLEASKMLNNLQNKREKCLFLRREARYVWVPFIVQGVKLSFVSLLAPLGSQHPYDNAENDCDRSHRFA